jgi:hypothetical protein
MKGTIMGLSPSRGLPGWGTFLVLLALVALTGCGGSTSTVKGKVSYNGKLLKGGNVTFISTTSGKPSVSAPIMEDGTYLATGVPTGKVKICVETLSLNPAGKRTFPNYKPPGGQKAPGGLASSPEDMSKRYVEIPSAYSDADKTTLTCEVKGGTTEHNIELK